MIIWSGKGILSVLVLIATFIGLILLLPAGLIEIGVTLSVSLFVAAAFSWLMGKKWNDQVAQVFIDKASGREVIIKPNHSLFWIKMQYWGIIFAILGLLVLGLVLAR